MMESISATQDDSSGANPSSVKSDDSSPRHEGGRGSPPPNCAICLGACRNKSFTDSCLHQFCFKCLLTWSKVKAECPLCKQNFRSIIHNVRSNQQYDEYTVEQRVEETTQTIDIDSLTNATRRFRYRTTLTLPRRETLAIQQLLLHYPLMADVFPPRAPPARRRREPTAFRRTVYRHNLWARPLPDFTGRFRDCTPDFYRYNDSQMHRLVPWINRELHYLLNENIGHISYVMTRILELLPQYHINSPEFREAMQRYFGDRTEHFLHELYCFASTPYDMTGYDRNVQYTTDSRISTMVNEVISSSESDASVDSDIVMVSHSEPVEPPAGPSRLPAPVYPHEYIPTPPTAANSVIPIAMISQSDTDDDSSEVMVVGYIKPPQDRTPEVVDLLGSDSDVIVQDGAQPEAAASGEASPPRAAPLVKLSLKRRRRSGADSDSSGEMWTIASPRRRRPPSALPSDTIPLPPPLAPPPRPSPPPSASSSARSTSLSSTSSSSSSSTCSLSVTELSAYDSASRTSSSSSGRRRRLTKRRPKRKSRRSRPVERGRRRGGRRDSPSRRRERRPESRERRGGRKSSSGKGVKSSKRSSEQTVATEATRVPPTCSEPSNTPPSSQRVRTPPMSESTRAPPQPKPARTPPPCEPVRTPPLPPLPDERIERVERAGPSDASRYRPLRSRKRRHASHESRRLKSVVNVMYKHSGDSNSGCSSIGTVPSGSTAITNSIRDVGAKESINGETTRRKGKASPVPSSYSPDDYLTATRTDVDDTDSEDNLPLNLSVQKTLYPL